MDRLKEVKPSILKMRQIETKTITLLANRNEGQQDLKDTKGSKESKDYKLLFEESKASISMLADGGIPDERGTSKQSDSTHLKKSEVR